MVRSQPVSHHHRHRCLRNRDLVPVSHCIPTSKARKALPAGEALTQAVMSSNGGQLAEACLKIASDYPGAVPANAPCWKLAAARCTRRANMPKPSHNSKSSSRRILTVLTRQGQQRLASLDAQGKSDQAAIAYQRAAGQAADASVALSAKFALAQNRAETQGKPARCRQVTLPKSPVPIRTPPWVRLRRRWRHACSGIENQASGRTGSCSAGYHHTAQIAALHSS